MAELRAVLRFLYLRGLTPLRLGTAVPPVGGWRLATLPPTMTAADVQLLLDSCDRSTGVGVRDLAIMTLVARLGLRSIEVARLELDDVDWRAGELVVRGKARRQDRLPLPADAGEAMAAYLARDRTPAGTRRLFLTCKAPRGPDPRGPGRGRRGAGVPARGPATGGTAPAAPRAGSRTAPPGRRAGRDQPGASSPGPGHHRPVCQGRPDHAAARRPALAGNSPVTALEKNLADYLQLRHSLGHQLAEAGWLLPGFVAYLDARGLPTVTIEAALAWAQQAPASPRGRVTHHRSTADDSRPRLRPLPVRHRPRNASAAAGPDAAPGALAPAVHLHHSRHQHAAGSGHAARSPRRCGRRPTRP